LLVAKEGEGLAVSKRAVQKINTERFDVKKLNERDVKEQYQVTVVSWGSSVSTVSDYGLDGRGSIPDRGRGFFPLTSASRPALGPTQPHVHWVLGALSLGVKRGQGVMLTTHPLLVPRLKKSRSYTSSQPKCASVECNRTTLPFYRVTIKNKFAAVEDLEDIGDINRAWDNIRENVKTSAQESLGYCESKHRKPWHDEKRSKLVNQRKQAKLQWLQDPCEANEGNLSDVR
jgi:hypothetical protein